MPGEAAVRAAIAARLGLLITVDETEKVYDAGGAELGTAGDLGIITAERGFAPDPTGPDEVVLGKWIGEDGSLSVHRVPVAAIVGAFGSLFVGGPPSAAAFVAACNAIPSAAPPGWTDPWPPPSWCRGLCRYAAKFKAEGILS